ncbi:MAG: hypothetical protein AAGC55_26080, partial [Myxococcota bacterium]
VAGELTRPDGGPGPLGVAELPADAGFAVTAPPLYDEQEQRVYLRIRIDRPGTYELPIQVGAGPPVLKRLSADPDAVSVSPQRASGLAAWWNYGDEPVLDTDGPIRAISLDHPALPQSWLGTPMPWWVYWLLVATIAALLLRRPMDVAL